MKKFTVILASMVLCLGTVGLLAGCGEVYDDTDLRNQLEQLREQLDELQNTEEDGIYYWLGETFTYVNSGIEWFSIKVEISPTSSDHFRMTLTNLNMPGVSMNVYLASRRFNSNNNTWASEFSLSSSSLGIGQSYSQSGYTISSFPATHIYFFHPTGIPLYAIFNVAH
ncbi:MAG: hypothetical protein FWH03_05105 [Firmicutes bacterium]|nr:hypothetical protein [Bacillota bacterium]